MLVDLRRDFSSIPCFRWMNNGYKIATDLLEIKADYGPVMQDIIIEILGYQTVIYKKLKKCFFMVISNVSSIMVFTINFIFS